MSEEMLQNAVELAASIEQHKDMVEARIRRAGMEPHPLIVMSIAKYWNALERLAAE